MQLTQLLPVIALSISVALAGHDENVMLCNCRDGNGVLSSQMAYYSGDPNSSPQALANVDSDFGKTVVWEGGRPVEGAFADTDVFTSVIAKPVGEGAYAGTGNNKYGPFFCYRNYRENLYTSDGKTCSSIYACNHRAPGVDIAVSVPGADYVEMDGWHNPRDILWAVWAKRLERSCDESPYDLGNGCQIQFSCHGDIPWATTNGMATTLVDVVSKQKDLVQQQAVKKRVCTDPCTENPGPKRGCCGWETQTIWTTKMARSVEIVSLDQIPSSSMDTEN